MTDDAVTSCGVKCF